MDDGSHLTVDALTDQFRGVADVAEARLSSTRSRITIRNERVVCTVDVKTGSGRRRWAGSTLSVDGVPQPLAEDGAQLVRIFADPDNGRRTVLDAMPPDVDPATAPAKARHVYHQFARAGAPVRVGHDGRRWIVGFDVGDNQFRAEFVRARGKTRQAGPMRVVVAGIDRTTEVDDRLENAVALFGGGHTAAPTAPDTDGAPETGGTGFGSVAQRRAVVIRN